MHTATDTEIKKSNKLHTEQIVEKVHGVDNENAKGLNILFKHFACFFLLFLLNLMNIRFTLTQFSPSFQEQLLICT